MSDTLGKIYGTMIGLSVIFLFVGLVLISLAGDPFVTYVIFMTVIAVVFVILVSALVVLVFLVILVGV